MASKAGKAAFDFARISTRLPGSVRSEFNAFRNRHDTIKASLGAIPEKPTPIDWQFYKESVNNTGLVASFLKAYEALKVPYPVDTMTETIKSQEMSLEGEIKDALAQADQNIKSFEEQLAALRAEKPYEDMTVDEYLKQHPALERQIQEEIRNHNWN